MSSKYVELLPDFAYLCAMSRELRHPEADRIDLSAVLEALSEPIRRQIVRSLLADGEQPCQAFDVFASKTNVSYHLARLREAGVTRTRLDGPYRRISVRVEDLAARFPGLLDAIVRADAPDPDGKPTGGAALSATIRS